MLIQITLPSRTCLIRFRPSSHEQPILKDSTQAKVQRLYKEHLDQMESSSAQSTANPIIQVTQATQPTDPTESAVAHPID
jgi:hypothetical protein